MSCFWECDEQPINAVDVALFTSNNGKAGDGTFVLYRCTRCGKLRDETMQGHHAAAIMRIVNNPVSARESR